MMIFSTRERTICWNSSKSPVTLWAFVQAAARPSIMENTRALITDMICGISSSNITSGRVFKPSVMVTMDRPGIRAYPAVIEKNAAPIEDR